MTENQTLQQIGALAQQLEQAHSPRERLALSEQIAALSRDLANDRQPEGWASDSTQGGGEVRTSDSRRVSSSEGSQAGAYYGGQTASQ